MKLIINHLMVDSSACSSSALGNFDQKLIRDLFGSTLIVFYIYNH